VAQQSPPSTFGAFGQTASNASPFGQNQASSSFGALAQQQSTFGGGVAQQGKCGILLFVFSYFPAKRYPGNKTKKNSENGLFDKKH
jgi:hypothetical protein